MKVDDVRGARAVARGGAWVKDIPLGELEITLNIKARSLENIDFVRIRGEQVRALPPELQENLTDEAYAQVIAEAIVGGLVVDWSLEEPCTVDLLTDPEIGVFLRGACLYAGAEVAKRGVKALEADAKN